MSYILEALRKAEAERERERGSVPDLHAQLPPPGSADLRTGTPRAAWLPWLAVGVVLAVVAGGAWHLWRRDVPATAAALAPVPTAAAVPATVPAAVPAPAPAPAPAPPPAPPPAPTTAPTTAAAPAAPPAPRPAEPRKPVPPAAKAAPKPAPKAQPPARLPALAELPADLRQQVPPLAVGGSVYSPQASARMVLLNGQVFQEGSNLAPELMLEQIRPKSAVLSIRGTRFELPL